MIIQRCCQLPPPPAISSQQVSCSFRQFQPPYDPHCSTAQYPHGAIQSLLAAEALEPCLHTTLKSGRKNVWAFGQNGGLEALEILNLGCRRRAYRVFKKSGSTVDISCLREVSVAGSIDSHGTVFVAAVFRWAYSA